MSYPSQEHGRRGQEGPAPGRLGPEVLQLSDVQNHVRKATLKVIF